MRKLAEKNRNTYRQEKSRIAVNLVTTSYYVENMKSDSREDKNVQAKEMTAYRVRNRARLPVGNIMLAAY